MIRCIFKFLFSNHEDKNIILDLILEQKKNINEKTGRKQAGV